MTQMLKQGKASPPLAELASGTKSRDTGGSEAGVLVFFLSSPQNSIVTLFQAHRFPRNYYEFSFGP